MPHPESVTLNSSHTHGESSSVESVEEEEEEEEDALMASED